MNFFIGGLPDVEIFDHGGETYPNKMAFQNQLIWQQKIDRSAFLE
jgi:hypothetical protein